ncbi:MAG: MarR family transcriptional regulator [Bacteroidetes bacterium]|jgi:DNA-binding MarR family transcriptional regulator|nr:MarR family transcriptional regulator [Bacteroidota bacterium]MDA1019847.1 MarR family transcriptional regulator [Bacteroidota bacterium]|tara:strand:- start:9476 stop:9934 length:459 start_codon:yes stop_codon:yes gene_type:complete
MDRIEGFGLYLDLTLKKISETYLRVFNNNNINLTIEQFVILQQIDRLGNNASQKDIVEINFRNRATTSRVISGLCKKNFVKKKRFKSDLKRYKLIISEEGYLELEKAQPYVQKLRNLSKKNIKQKDFNELLVILEKIRNNYELFDESVKPIS